MARINLGDRVRDKISGIEGIVFGKTEWMTGCDHIGIKREGVAGDGKPFDTHWCDEPLVEIVQAGAMAPLPKVPETGQRTGGPSLHGYPAR